MGIELYFQTCIVDITASCAGAVQYEWLLHTLILKGSHHIVIILIGNRSIQPCLFQKILPDHHAGIRNAFRDIIGTGRYAVIGDNILPIAHVLNGSVVVRGIGFQIRHQVNDNFLLHQVVYLIIHIQLGHQLGIISGGNYKLGLLLLRRGCNTGHINGNASCLCRLNVLERLTPGSNSIRGTGLINRIQCSECHRLCHRVGNGHFRCGLRRGCLCTCLLSCRFGGSFFRGLLRLLHRCVRGRRSLGRLSRSAFCTTGYHGAQHRQS